MHYFSKDCAAGFFQEFRSPAPQSSSGLPRAPTALPELSQRSPRALPRSSQALESIGDVDGDGDGDSDVVMPLRFQDSASPLQNAPFPNHFPIQIDISGPGRPQAQIPGSGPPFPLDP